MGKLNIKEIKRNGIRVFNTKKQALDYISNTSFKVDYIEYECLIFRNHNKWFVKWNKKW